MNEEKYIRFTEETETELVTEIQGKILFLIGKNIGKKCFNNALLFQQNIKCLF